MAPWNLTWKESVCIICSLCFMSCNIDASTPLWVWILLMVFSADDVKNRTVWFQTLCHWGVMLNPHRSSDCQTVMFKPSHSLKNTSEANNPHESVIQPLTPDEWQIYNTKSVYVFFLHVWYFCRSWGEKVKCWVFSWFYFELQTERCDWLTQSEENHSLWPSLKECESYSAVLALLIIL